MIFKDIHEARKWFRQYREATQAEIDLEFLFYRSDVKLDFGDWVLFQHINMYHKPAMISRPILGIFAGMSVWDMAGVFNFIEPARAWMFSHEIESKYPPNYIGLYDPDVQSFPLWHENIKLLGHWKNKPTLAELKNALNEVAVPES